MEPWIALSIMAAAFQTVRFMLQKSLSMGALSAMGATFARFAYAAPLAMVLASGYLAWRGAALPDLSGFFWIHVAVGGLSQILATWCVVLLFAERNFAVGITFKKTEVIQTAIVGFIVLGDRVSLGGMVAIVLGLFGVLVLSDMPEGQGRGLRRVLSRATGLGLASGALFAVSAVSYRAATLEVPSEDAFLRAFFTVSCVTLSQTLGLAAWLAWREPGQLAAVWHARGRAIWMGVMSMGGSVGWFSAFTMQNAAYVFAVGQVEVIFSIAASVMFFKEKISSRELAGIAVLTASILLLVFLG